MFANGGRWGKCGERVVGWGWIVRVCVWSLFFFFCSMFSVVFICWLLFPFVVKGGWVDNFVFLVLFMACVLFPQLVYMLIVYMNEFWLEALLIPRVQRMNTVDSGVQSSSMHNYRFSNITVMCSSWLHANQAQRWWCRVNSVLVLDGQCGIVAVHFW